VSRCLGAQHALRRLDDTDLQVMALARRVALLAAELGVDLECLAHVERVEPRGGYITTWAEAEAAGLDPTTGQPT
jgi:hypothetical protein